MKKSAIMVLIILFTIIVSNSAIAGKGHGNNRGYNGHYYGGHGNRGHGGGRGYYPGALLGGLIVGGIIGSSLNAPYYRRPVPVYVETYPVNITTGSNFLLKSNGDCFLITNSPNGNQILSSVPQSNCR